MQSKKNIEKNFVKFTTAEIKELKTLMEDIDFLTKNGKISEDGLRVLMNAYRTLDNFKDTYILRLISILKQNHMLG